MAEMYLKKNICLGQFREKDFSVSVDRLFFFKKKFVFQLNENIFNISELIFHITNSIKIFLQIHFTAKNYTQAKHCRTNKFHGQIKIYFCFALYTEAILSFF